MAVQVDDAFDRALTGREVRVVFQPIVALESGEVVGMEAFARGPEGTILEHPAPLFAAARRAGRLAELDWVARAAAFEAFTRAGLPAALSLCVNVEPESLGTPCPADLVEAVSRAESLLRVFVEVDDHALAADPAGLVVAVDRARSSGWGVVVAGVGGARTSLAALPVVGADLVKVDMALFRRRDRAEVSAITLSVLRHIETSGAALLIQGVEDAEDAAWARALGATYAQGYFFGRPGPLETEYPVPRAPIPLLRMADDEQAPQSAFAMVSDLGTTRVTRSQLFQLTQVVYRAALTPGAAPVVLASPGVGAAIPDAPPDEFPAPPTPALLSVLFAAQIDPEPFEGMRGVSVPATDPIAREQFLVVLGEREVVALVAAPTPGEPDMVDAVLTQDPVRVHYLARSLFERIPGRAPAPDADPDRAARGDDGDGEVAPARRRGRSALAVGVVAGCRGYPSSPSQPSGPEPLVIALAMVVSVTSRRRDHGRRRFRRPICGLPARR